MQANWEYFSYLLFGFNITIKNSTSFSRLTAIKVILKNLEYLKLFKILERNNKRNLISTIKLNVLNYKKWKSLLKETKQLVLRFKKQT